jgi:hypothetical protein
MKGCIGGSQAKNGGALSAWTKADVPDVDKALILAKEVLKLESPDKRMSEAHQCALKDISPGEQMKLVGAEDLVALKPPVDQDVVSRTLRNHWPFPSTVSLAPGVQRVLLHQLIGTDVSIPRARQDPVLPRASPSPGVEGVQHLHRHHANNWTYPRAELHQQSECTFGHRGRIHRTVCNRLGVIDWSEPRHHFRGHGYLLRCARGICVWELGRCGRLW